MGSCLLVQDIMFYIEWLRWLWYGLSELCMYTCHDRDEEGGWELGIGEVWDKAIGVTG